MVGFSLVLAERSIVDYGRILVSPNAESTVDLSIKNLRSIPFTRPTASLFPFPLSLSPPSFSLSFLFPFLPGSSWGAGLHGSGGEALLGWEVRRRRRGAKRRRCTYAGELRYVFLFFFLFKNF